MASDKVKEVDMVRINLCLVQAFLFAAALQAQFPEPLIHFGMDEMSDGVIANTGTAEGADLTVGSKCSLIDRSVSGKSLFFGGVPGDGSHATFTCPELKSRTVAFWMFRENAVSQAHAGNPTILPWLVGGASRLQIRLEESADPQLGNDALVPYIGSGAGTYMRGCTAAHRGAWVHLAITISVGDETKVSDEDTEYVYDWKVYANGVLSAGGQRAVATNIAAKGYCYLGSLSNGTRPFYGSIDDFRIYGEALGDEQVWNLFSDGAENVSTSKLVGHWPLDEWSDVNGVNITPDISGYGKALELSAKVTRTNGVDGSAVHFSGEVGSYAKVKLAKECSSSTWAFWMRQSSDSENLKNGSDKNSPRLVHEAVSKFALIMDVGFDSRRFVYQLQNTAPASKAISSAAVVHQGVWQHVVFVNRCGKDENGGFTIKPELWINGRLSGSGGVEQSDVLKIKQNADVIFGSANTASPSSFEGEFDDIRIYSGALSSNEIVRLYRSVVPVSVPDDFTCAGKDCVLSGTVAGLSGGSYRTGFNGSFSWSVVSAPEGAEPVIDLKNNLVTPVILPLEGKYVFRLTSKDEFGGEKHDEVEVTRDDASGLTPPVAPDVDAAMAEAAADVAAGEMIDSGLIRYWSGAGLTPEKSHVGSGTSLGIGWRDADLNRIASGGGIAPYAFDFGDFYKGAGIGETTEKADSSGGNSAWPADEWRTFSLWMYQDSEKNHLHYSPCIVSARTTLWINLNRYDNPKSDGKIQDSGIMIIQTGGTRTSSGSAQSRLWFKAPFSFTNRWTHLVAMINRHDSSKIELYLDGVKRTPDSSTVGTSGGQNTGGRVQGNLHFGGIDYNALDYSTQSNALYSVAHDPETGEFYSRTFPGKLTDIRLYNRHLSDAEVGYLFRHPGIAFNQAPVVGSASSSKPVVKKKPVPLSAVAQDDGSPCTGISYECVVVKGDASRVSFADRNAKETTVTVKEADVFAFSLKCTDGERTTYAIPVEFTVLKSGTVLTIR